MLINTPLIVLKWPDVMGCDWDVWKKAQQDHFLA